MSTRPLLVVIDGHAVAYRAFFALKVEHFKTREGEPTNAVFGFTRRVMEILQEGPDYFAISFDRGLSGRDELYAEYKGTREKMPEELSIQMIRIEEVVRAFNIPVLALDGYEADDIIGTVTLQAENLGCDVRIVTGDGDLLQLVNAHTRVQLPQRNDVDKIFGVDEFGEKYPLLQPYQLVDIKALMGDSSDNIPGVAGIGEKTALKLLQAYGTLENLYDHVYEQKGALKDKLVHGRELAFLSKKLATIQRDVPIKLSLEACRTHDYEARPVEALFRRLDFRALTRQLHKLRPELLEQPSREMIESAEVSTDDLFASREMETVEASYDSGIDTPLPQLPIEAILVDTPEKLQTLVEKLQGATLIAFDTETTGKDRLQAKLVGISLAVNDREGYYIPLGHIDPHAPLEDEGGILPQGINNDKKASPVQHDLFGGTTAPPPQLDATTVFAALRPFLENPAIPKMGHNIKYDAMVLQRYGIRVNPLAYDTMLAEWVYDTTSRNLGLKNLALIELGQHMRMIEELIGSGKNQVTFARVPIDTAVPYAVEDAVVTIRLRPILNKKMVERQGTELFETLEMPLIPVVADMERHGVLLDLPYLKALETEFKERLATIEQEIYTISGYGQFNINSLNQLSEVLFGKLQLRTVGLKKTKTGNFSLTAEVLEEMQDAHPIIPKILDYRGLNKLLNTYIEAVPALVNPYTGRVHTSYNQTGAATGRFSSSDPNLQNIPIRTDEGRRIRKAFIAPEGYLLLSVDYSQVELRILAHYSDDGALLEAFRQERDIHTSTAAAVFGVPMDEVTFEQRSFAKSVNFGLMYGMGAFRLMKGSDLTHSQAQQFINDYFARFPGVKAYLDGSKQQAAQLGYVETLFGRRRYFPELQRSDTPTIMRQRAEREAINAPIQGTAADILKKAMLDIYRTFEAQKIEAPMILQVHDELVLEVPEDAIDKVGSLVVEIMEAAYPLKARLKADAQIGRNWQDMETFEVTR